MALGTEHAWPAFPFAERRPGRLGCDGATGLGFLPQDSSLARSMLCFESLGNEEVARGVLFGGSGQTCGAAGRPDPRRCTAWDGVDSHPQFVRLFVGASLHLANTRDVSVPTVEAAGIDLKQGSRRLQGAVARLSLS